MGVVFGNQPCIEPTKVYDYCSRHGLPVDWFGLPNRFMTSVGAAPGRGWLLMRRGEINSLDREDLHDLKFDDGSGGTITIKNLVFIRARCVTPGVVDDPNSCYLIDVRDARYLAANEFYGTPAFAKYNIRARSGSQDYYAESMNPNGSVAWTWQTMLDDLWEMVIVPELGPVTGPTIPAAAIPATNPEGFEFFGIPAWLAYNELLTKLGCAFVLEHNSATPHIYQIGASDPDLTAAEARYNAVRLRDDYTIESKRAKIPETVDVRFHRYNTHYGTEKTTPVTGSWAMDAVVSKTSDSDGLATQEDSSVVLWDDLPALTDFAGSVTNDAALQTRADQRAADYYRMIHTGGTLSYITYIGIIDHIGFKAGKKVTGVCWKETGHGYQTEVVRYPPPIAPAENGSWKLDGGGIDRLKDPIYLGRQGLPNYPDTVNLIRISGAITASFVHPGFVQQLNPTSLVYTDGEACWAYFTNMANSPIPAVAVDGQFLGRLNGVKTVAGVTKPLYIIEDAVGLGDDGSVDTQSFKDGADVTRTMTLLHGRIISIV